MLNITALVTFKTPISAFFLLKERGLGNFCAFKKHSARAHVSPIPLLGGLSAKAVPDTSHPVRATAELPPPLPRCSGGAAPKQSIAGSAGVMRGGWELGVWL